MNIRYLFLAALTLVTLGAQSVFGQATWNGIGNWTTDAANWSPAPPIAGENVLIGSGTVNLTTNQVTNVGNYGILNIDGSTLNVNNGGSANFVGESNLGTVGGGKAVINVGSGGSLDFNGTTNLGREDGGGLDLHITGSGSITTHGPYTDSWWGEPVLISVRGPNAQVTFGGTHFVGSVATVEAIITNASSHSAINIPDTLDIIGGASLRVAFDGVSPSLGDRWTIYDYANSTGGTFSNLDTSLLTGGVSFTVDYNATGTINANAVQVVVSNTLDVLVDTATGAVTLRNPVAGGLPYDIEGYTVSSDSGSLDATEFTGLGEANWLPAMGAQGPTFINETNFINSTLISSGATFPLGDIFAGPATGDANGDRVVNGLDYLVWAANFDTNPGPDGDPSDGDFNDDGAVDGLDYLAWAGAFGDDGRDLSFSFLTSAGDIVNGTVTYYSSVVSSAVPEPSTMLLAGLASL
ncbi:MAG: hypothetical protein KDA63_08300, partial [Planctomycetales bacterium]|nr:hypothetical protein [Planctomycetales bacterium]